jgi:hypothetical protein
LGLYADRCCWIGTGRRRETLKGIWVEVAYSKSPDVTRNLKDANRISTKQLFEKIMAGKSG